MLAPDLHATQPIRVLLVDDSGVSRALMTRWIDESGCAVVSASASHAAAAVVALKHNDIDVVVLDVEMPHIDGLAALPLLLEARPGVRVLMASSLTDRGADVTLEALRLGASDAIAKPRAGWAARGGANFRDDLIDRIRILGTEAPDPSAAPLQAARSGLAHAWSGGIRAVPAVVAIGGSTGGPNALFPLIGALPSDFAAPILVAQHMPALFTAELARQLGDRSALRVVEARHGVRPESGTVYLAPGGCDMTVRGSGGDLTLIVEGQGDRPGSHPSVDRLFVSASEACGARVLAVLLSGMGQDGRDGASTLVSGGGTVMAQDRASSIVWGMPGAVVRAGLALEVLPPLRLAEAMQGAVMQALTEIR